MGGSFPQTVEPPYYRGPEARLKYFTHKFVIPQIEGHELGIGAYMLYQVSFTVIKSKGRASKMPKHFGTFYIFGEW